MARPGNAARASLRSTGREQAASFVQSIASASACLHSTSPSSMYAGAVLSIWRCSDQPAGASTRTNIMAQLSPGAPALTYAPEYTQCVIAPSMYISSVGPGATSTGRSDSGHANQSTTTDWPSPADTPTTGTLTRSAPNPKATTCWAGRRGAGRATSAWASTGPAVATGADAAGADRSGAPCPGPTSGVAGTANARGSTAEGMGLPRLPYCGRLEASLPA